MGIAKLRKTIKIALLERLLRGKNVTCNICGRSYSTFLPYLGRINAQCPHCKSLERSRLLWHFLTNLRLLNSDTKLLHIAPDPGLFNVLSNKLGNNYIPADKFEEGYSYPKGTVHMDVTDIPYANSSFDMVICIHVLEHVQDDAKAIAEIYRILKKGGFAILQVPYDADREHTYEDASITMPEERKKHFLQSDHVRIYGRDFMQRFLRPGFSLEYENYTAQLSKEVKERYVFKDEKIFLLRK